MAGIKGAKDSGARKYERDHGFTSAKIAVAAGPVATPIWSNGTAATYPAAGRTAGQKTTIYTLSLENETASHAKAWLEIGGTEITIRFDIPIACPVVIDFKAGMTIGDQDVDINASVAGVKGVLVGTQR